MFLKNDKYVCFFKYNWGNIRKIEAALPAIKNNHDMLQNKLKKAMQKEKHILRKRTPVTERLS